MKSSIKWLKESSPRWKTIAFVLACSVIGMAIGIGVVYLKEKGFVWDW